MACLQGDCGYDSEGYDDYDGDFFMIMIEGDDDCAGDVYKLLNVAMVKVMMMNDDCGGDGDVR